MTDSLKSGARSVEAIGFSLLDLPADALIAVLSAIRDPESLAAACCTCRKLREAGYAPSLWQPLSCRWRNLNSSLYTQPSMKGAPAAAGTVSRFSLAATTSSNRVDWKALWAGANGWAAPAFNVLLVEPRDDFVSATCAEAGDTHDTLYLGTGSAIQAWHIPHDSGSQDDQSSSTWVAPKLLSSHSIPASLVINALAMIGGNRLAAGTNFGGLAFYSHHADTGFSLLSQTGKRAPNAARTPAVDIQHVDGTSMLVALHDATFSLQEMGPHQRNLLRLYDTAAEAELGIVNDMLDSYEIVCCCSLASVGSPSEILAGSVHGGYCSSCYQAGTPSLCCHKSSAHRSALCTFDLRAPLLMTNRYSLTHRSMYPSMCCARGLYLFVSSVGQPLAVWDRRYMSVPLYEEQRLNHQRRPWAMPASPAVNEASGGDGGGSGNAAAGGRHCHRGFAGDRLAGEGAMRHAHNISSSTHTMPSNGTQPIKHSFNNGDSTAASSNTKHHPSTSTASHSRPPETGRIENNGTGGSSVGNQQNPCNAVPRPAALGMPRRAAEHQGLWLDCNDDVLVGRADNGMLWRWDLSATLGWTAGGTSAGGSWKALEDDGRSGHIWHWDWPLPLGALPCESSLASVQLLGDANPHMMVCPSCDTVDSQEYVACLRLARLQPEHEP